MVKTSLPISGQDQEFRRMGRSQEKPQRALPSAQLLHSQVVRKGQVIDVYYKEFVKLSRYAPLMTKEQKLNRFILGLEGQLAEEVNALRPTSLADALIHAKAKLSSFQVGEKKRTSPFLPSALFWPHKVNPSAPQVNRSLPLVAPKPIIQPVKVNALPVTQSGKHI